MICGRKKTSSYNNTQQVRKYLKRFRFPENKLAMYIEKFNRIGDSKGFSKDEFRDNMGLLGLDSTCLIANRIFDVMNKSHSETVTLKEYLEYMDILLYGDHDEKSEQSFKLITNSESDGITFDDFVEWIVNIWKMYNSLTGCEISTTSEDIQYYFDKLDRKKDGVIDLQEYKEAMMENKNLYEWFEFANQGMAEDDDEIELDQWTYNKSLELIEKDVNNCLEILMSEYRNSRRSTTRLTKKNSFFSFAHDAEGEDEIEESSNLEVDRPDFNRGDEDIPDEINLDENEQNSFDQLQLRLIEILGCTRALRNQGSENRLSEQPPLKKKRTKPNGVN